MTEQNKESSKSLGVDQEVAASPLINSKNHGPGRELDALIAKKVFGIRVQQSTHPSDEGEFYNLNRMRPGDNYPTVEIERYSTDIAAAWEVVEKMRERGFVFSLSDIPGESMVRSTADFTSTPLIDPARRQYSACAESPSLAICLAALRAVDA